MLIDQGSNTDAIPQPQDAFVALTAMVAVGTGSIAVDLQDIPNAPIRYYNDPSNRSRHEDSAIAWSWKTFIDDPSKTTVPLLVPMAKAGYRAMNATQEFAAQQKIDVPKTFIIAGASKRGWATWLTAAVDAGERIIGAIPIVMDLLNFQANLHHHYRSLGGWTFAFNDYYEVNITRFIDTDKLTQMAAIIDPYNYFDRYKNMRLLQIQSAGDEFFILDNEAAFWPRLQEITGGTFLRRMPNADHICVGHIMSLFFTMRSFYMSIYDKQPLPKMTWVKGSNNTHGFIRATVDFSTGPKPSGVTGLRARTLNDKRRDFRLTIANPENPTKAMPNPVIWFDIPVVVESQTATTIVYSLTIATPMNGWEGFFIQVDFPGPDSTLLQLTTETQIIPDTYPTDDCHGDGCAGKLV